ncbi:hypothetical protein L798_11947 [Zootermopsis nevadensis]|uniref:Uncharacterized protein n=1 Tax=Zootermopsis nevadensis TaxID=136037 RepID=A0A067R552_ZOONE|nr:hypothetical protein L798_11947 [Zootermopsis nevadensis]
MSGPYKSGPFRSIGTPAATSGSCKYVFHTSYCRCVGPSAAVPAVRMARHGRTDESINDKVEYHTCDLQQPRRQPSCVLIIFARACKMLKRRSSAVCKRRGAIYRNFEKEFGSMIHLKLIRR